MADPDIPHVSNWVSGAHAPHSGTKIIVRNPATERPIASIDATSPKTVDTIITSAHARFKTGIWSKADASTRFAVLTKAASLLRSRLPEFVQLEVQQTGRPIREMRTQLARIPEWLEYFASLARTHEGRVTPFKGPVVNTMTRLPLGVVVQITPWNHPLLIATKKMAAALAAGCTVVVKPSELAPLSVLKMGELMQEAGLPDGTLTILSGHGWETGKALSEAKGLSRIDFTGGGETYGKFALEAARNMTPITAELGGKAPVCLFESIDVETAVKAALFASFIAAGQTCVTGSRLLVHQDIYDEFVQLLVQRTNRLRIGDPMDDRTQVGAVISQASVDRCQGFVDRAVQQQEKEGGVLLCGGKPTRVNGKGFYFEPTLIATTRSSELACNEVFGPVIAIIKCKSEQDIIEVANSSAFALGASVWTKDFSQAHRVADQIEAGIVWVNGHHLNDPSSAWGGFKDSGIGKENGVEAYESYTRVKSTVINYGVAPTWFDEEVGEARYG